MVGTDLSLNVNTVVPQVLRSVSDQMSDSIVRQLVNWREASDGEGKPHEFRSMDDIRHAAPSIAEPLLSELEAVLEFRSEVFIIRATSRVRNMVKQRVFVVRRSSNDCSFQLLAHYQPKVLTEFPLPDESM